MVNVASREHLYQIRGAKSLLRQISQSLESEGSVALSNDPTYLRNLLSGYPQLGNIAVLGPQGNVLNSAQPLPGPINMSNYEAIQRAMRSDGIETGVYVIGPIVKRPLLHLAKAVKDRSGLVRCVIFVALDLDYMKKLFQKFELPPGYVMLIVDRDGTILANSSSGTGSTENDYQPGVRIKELSEKYGSSGSRRIPAACDFVTAPMPDVAGVNFATKVPYEIIYAQANQTFLRMIGLLSLLTFSTVALIVFLEEFALLRYLRSLARATARFGAGDYSVRVEIPGDYGELKRMGDVFNTMAAALETRHREITETNAQLERMSRHLQIARESECLRIARDLHDEVGQVLTSIKMDVSGFASCCAQRQPLPCQSRIDLMREKLNDLVGFIRRIASDLRPPVLDRMGVVQAIHLLSRNIERNSDLMINVEANIDEPFDWLTSITIYRIVQESLTNVVRHAHATEVHITLSIESDRILLKIQDNGSGFNADGEAANSLGLMGMRERARLMNGSCTICSSPSGTTVEAIIPKSQPVGYADIIS